MIELHGYEGRLHQLRRHVASTKVQGEWKKLAQGYWSFECQDGVSLHWRASTDVLSFDGPPHEAARFRAKLIAVGRLEDETLAGFYGDVWELMCQVDATGIPGTWQMKPFLVWRYRTSDGAMLVWDEPSGRLTFTGRKSAVRKLERKMLEEALVAADAR